MSLIVSDLMDKLIEVVPTATGFADKKRLSNPYALEQNSTKQLADGWGLLMGDANLATTYCQTAFSDISVSISLTRQIPGSEEDATLIDKKVKGLQTDLHELILFIGSNGTVDWPDGVFDLRPASTDAIEYFNNDTFRMISTAANFVARIEETLD